MPLCKKKHFPKALMTSENLKNIKHIKLRWVVLAAATVGGSRRRPQGDGSKALGFLFVAFTAFSGLDSVF